MAFSIETCAKVTVLTKHHGGDALHNEGQPSRVHGINADAQQLRLAICEFVLIGRGSVALIAVGLLLSAPTAAILQTLILAILLAFLHSCIS